MKIYKYTQELKKIIKQMKENANDEGNTFNLQYFVGEMSPLYTGYSYYQCNKLKKLARKIIKK